jgi:multiple sugar transport system ATP-binding protein
LHVKLGEYDFTTLADPDSGLGPGDDVTIDLRDPLFFNAAGERVLA